MAAELPKLILNKQVDENNRLNIEFWRTSSGTYSISFQDITWPSNYYLIWTLNKEGNQYGWFGTQSRADFVFTKKAENDNWLLQVCPTPFK